MKTLLLHLLALGVASVACAQGSEGQEVTLTGTLQGGRIAIGGETTGWVLQYRDDTGEHSVEVLLPPPLLAQAKSGATVRVRGVFTTRQYVERGAVRLFTVRRLEDVNVGAPRFAQLTVDQLNAQQK